MPEGFARIAAVSLPVHLGDVEANEREITLALERLRAQGVQAAVREPNAPVRLQYPCSIEVNYTRPERAGEVLRKVRGYGQDARYGETTHIVCSVLRGAQDLEAFI